jgi:ABC-type multidrug transport system ATPase subunit
LNGAGKTTLFLILATLHPPTSGDVLYKGISIYKNLINYRKALGFCPQTLLLKKRGLVETVGGVFKDGCLWIL